MTNEPDPVLSVAQPRPPLTDRTSKDGSASAGSETRRIALMKQLQRNRYSADDRRARNRDLAKDTRLRLATAQTASRSECEMRRSLRGGSEHVFCMAHGTGPPLPVSDHTEARVPCAG